MEEKKYFIHKTSVIDKNVKIGTNSKIWHFSHIQSNARIGNNCSLGQNVNIANNVSIGNYVKIQNNVSVYEGVTLEDYVFCRNKANLLIFVSIFLKTVFRVRQVFGYVVREIHIRDLSEILSSKDLSLYLIREINKNSLIR